MHTRPRQCLVSKRTVKVSGGLAVFGRDAVVRTAQIQTRCEAFFPTQNSFAVNYRASYSRCIFDTIVQQYAHGRDLRVATALVIGVNLKTYFRNCICRLQNCEPLVRGSRTLWEIHLVTGAPIIAVRLLSLNNDAIGRVTAVRLDEYLQFAAM